MPREESKERRPIETSSSETVGVALDDQLHIVAKFIHVSQEPGQHLQLSAFNVDLNQACRAQSGIADSFMQRQPVNRNLLDEGFRFFSGHPVLHNCACAKVCPIVPEYRDGPFRVDNSDIVRDDVRKRVLCQVALKHLTDTSRRKHRVNTDICANVDNCITFLQCRFEVRGDCWLPFTKEEKTLEHNVFDISGNKLATLHRGLQWQISPSYTPQYKSIPNKWLTKYYFILTKIEYE